MFLMNRVDKIGCLQITQNNLTLGIEKKWFCMSNCHLETFLGGDCLLRKCITSLH